MPSKKVTKNKKQVITKQTVKTVVKVVAPRTSRLSVPVYSLTGRSTGKLSLPKEIFGIPVNEKLLAQALRVYMTNQKTLPGSTKTRGQVEGSTAKIYRQKGTGRARHGSIRAPIFVGGGIVFGPKMRKVRLDLPKKMKKAALLSALSSKVNDQDITGVSGLEKATGKTKEIVKLTQNLKLKTALIVTGEKMDNIARAARNIKEVTVLPVNQLNAYEVLRHQSLLISKEAVGRLTGKVTGKK